MAKMGRPKIANPKNIRLMFRLTEEEYHRLKKCAEDHDLTVTEAVRKGVRMFMDSK